MQRRHAVAFTVFCLLTGSVWLADTAFPSSLPPLERQSLHYLLVAVAACALLLVRSRSIAFPQLSLLPVAAASLLLFALPAWLNEFAYAQSSKNGIALFALVPLFVVIGATAFPGTASPPGRSMMMPALIGFSGALLLLPFQLPSTFREVLLFAAVFAGALCTAAGSLWMNVLLRGSPILPALAVLAGANALLLAIPALVRHPGLPPLSALPLELLHVAALDLPQLLLLVWLLRELSPTRLASRFLLVPLLSTIEGLTLLRPPFDPRLVLGVLLVAAGGITLLLANVPAESEGPPSLGLR